MKVLLQIAFFFLSSLAFTQEWRDSLEVAQKAYESKDFDKALKYYESAQKKAPEDIDLSDEIGQSAYKARDFKKAEEVFQQNGNNKSTSKEKANNYHNIGNSRMKNKDYQGAVEAYKDALRLNPDDKYTRYNLSEAIRQMKNEQKKQQQQQDQKDKQDQQNQNQGDSNEQQQGEQGDQQNQDSQNNSNNQQNGGQEGDEQNKGQLPNKTVEKMLDELMKQEAETKRRASGTSGGNRKPRSGKDW